MNITCSPDEAKSRLSRFKDKPWRMYQKDAVKFTMESDKKFVVLDAPTGSGKTIIGMTCGVMAGLSNYLCSTKMLQEQIKNDFTESVVLFGRNNYPCLLDNTKTCEQCVSTKANPCSIIHKCLYKVAKNKALDSSLRTLNYMYLLKEVQFAGRFSGTPFTVIDEIDALEQVLIGVVSLQFTERSLFRLGLQDGPYRKTVTAKDGLSSWKEFGKEALYRSKSIYEKLDKEIDTFERIEDDWHFQKIRERDHFKHLNEQCQIFLNNVGPDWILENVERQGSRQATTLFRPLWLTAELSNSFLFRHSEKFLLMSATCLPKPIFCKTLGLDPDDVDWKTLPSNFPVERRPIHVWPVAEVTHKNTDNAIPKLVKAIKKILAWHPHEKGLIQGVSYSLCRKIFDELKSDRIKIHTPQDRQEVLEEFMVNDDDSVFLSPSCERGVSLEGSKCEFVICIKAPYLSLMDKVTSLRLYSSKIGQVWYKANMMMSVVQSCGRGMRSADDHCVCYLIDSKISEVYTKSPSLWPPWFADAVSFTDNGLLD